MKNLEQKLANSFDDELTDIIKSFNDDDNHHDTIVSCRYVGDWLHVEVESKSKVGEKPTQDDMVLKTIPRISNAPHFNELTGFMGRAAELSDNAKGIIKDNSKYATSTHYIVEPIHKKFDKMVKEAVDLYNDLRDEKIFDVVIDNENLFYLTKQGKNIVIHIETSEIFDEVIEFYNKCSVREKFIIMNNFFYSSASYYRFDALLRHAKAAD